MPIYEYRHTAEHGPECAKDFEVMGEMSDETLSVCPTCGKPVKKLISAFLPHKNIMSASNLRDKGFTKLTRRDKGVYERET